MLKRTRPINHQNPKWLSKYVSSIILSLLTGTVITLPLHAATFTVTEPACTGAGSIAEAISLANASPGPDTIEIEGGLQISGCKELDPGNPYDLVITDDLVINGNFAKFQGYNNWVTPNGNVSPIYADDSSCPLNLNWIIIGASNGVFQIGQFGQDNDGLSVEIYDLFVDQMSMLAEVETNASLKLTRVFTREITSMVSCDRPLLYAKPGADISIDSSRFTRSKLWSDTPPSVTGMIQNTGPSNSRNSTLTITNSLFDSNFQLAAVTWTGDANIVSSRFYNSGGLFFSNGTANLINSIMYQEGRLNGRDRDWLYVWDADLNIRASTISFAHTSCDKTFFPDTCVGPNWPGYDFIHRAPIMSFLNGSIDFKESVVQVRLPDYGDSVQPLLWAYDSSTMTADPYTFIQPTALQDAAALRILTSQPALLTGSPAMPLAENLVDLLFIEPPSVITPVTSASGTPGILIDVIPDAGAGGANQLTDHEGNILPTDALGNPRADQSNRRNSGAVQTTLSPHLLVSEVSDSMVKLSWSQPHDPAGGTLTGYDICYGTGITPNPVALGTSCPGTLQSQSDGTLSATISDLTNAVPYWFLVRASSTTGALPWSNAVTETPYGTIQTPVVVAIPGERRVDLSWHHVDGAGKQINRYIVQWKIQGDNNWLAHKQLDLPEQGQNTNTGELITISVTANDHAMGHTYTYAVLAQTTDGETSQPGYATAAPIETVSYEGGSRGGSVDGFILLLLAASVVYRIRKEHQSRYPKPITLLLSMTTACLLLPQSAHSEENAWSVGLSYGRASSDFDDKQFIRDIEAGNHTISDVSVDSVDNGWKLFVAHEFSHKLGIELSYADLGKLHSRFAAVSSDTQKLLQDVNKLHGFMVSSTGLAARYSHPVEYKLSVFVSGGIHFWEASDTIKVSDVRLKRHSSGNDYMLGAGMQFRTDLNFDLRLSYDNYKVDEDHIHYVAMGALYHF